MTFNIHDPLGRHGDRQLRKLNESEDLSYKDKFKLFMSAMSCAESWDKEDLNTAQYLFLQTQAERL